MAVTLLIALLSSLGAIGAVRTFKRWSVEENAKRFFLTARYARVWAIENQRPCLLVVDAEQKRYFLSSPDESDDGTEPTMVIQNLWTGRQELVSHVEFERIQKQTAGSIGTEEANQIEFGPDGKAQSAGVQIGDGKTHYSILISTTGRARVYAGPLQETEPDEVDLDLLE